LIRTHHEGGDTLELGGGGELGCFQFANTSFEAVNASAEDGEFGFEFFEKATQFVGDFSDAVETCVQQCCSLVTGHRPVAAEGAVGVTSDAAVLLNQVAERLIGPVSWHNIGEVRRDVRNVIDVVITAWEALLLSSLVEASTARAAEAMRIG
jgi:hypothetical protein